MQKVRVLVIDDSALVRQILTQILRSDPEIEVVGSASDPYIAREKIKKLNPDVLTLDIEMPRMDGITFLKNLMRLRPMPVVMVSSLTEKGAEVTLEALELGAVDFVAKPKDDLKRQLQEYSETIIDKVKTAARAKVKALESGSEPRAAPEKKYSVDAVVKKTTPSQFEAEAPSLVAIGASTGGTEAIREVLVNLPADFPGIVITQHIPEAFSGPFALRLDRSCVVNVKEAEDGDVILPGHAYVAPGSDHLLVVRKNGKYICKLNDGPPVNRHRPSVDVLFRSVAQAAGEHGVGVILTGMGNDGAQGMKEMRETGAMTIAQDENTSVVWGMPGEAVKGGGVEVIKPLRGIAPYLKSLF